MNPLALYLHNAVEQVAQLRCFEAFLSLWEAHKYATGLEWALRDGFDLEADEIYQIRRAYKLAMEFDLPLDHTRIPYVVEVIAQMASEPTGEAA